MTETKEKYVLSLPARSLDPGIADNTITVEVWHNGGGVNIMAGTVEGRAICCSMSPCERRPDGIMIIGLTRGLRYLIEKVLRRNDKKMAQHFETVKGEIAKKQGKAWEVLQEVLKREKMELEEG